VVALEEALEEETDGWCREEIEHALTSSSATANGSPRGPTII
jgi:hypothetical protein